MSRYRWQMAVFFCALFAWLLLPDPVWGVRLVGAAVLVWVSLDSYREYHFPKFLKVGDPVVVLDNGRVRPAWFIAKLGTKVQVQFDVDYNQVSAEYESVDVGNVYPSVKDAAEHFMEAE